VYPESSVFTVKSLLTATLWGDESLGQLARKGCGVHSLKGATFLGKLLKSTIQFFFLKKKLVPSSNFQITVNVYQLFSPKVKVGTSLIIHSFIHRIFC
jgi:hypothetical protein